MKYILSPSILSADFGHLERDVKSAVNAGAEYIHFDVMDGCFVPSISFGMPVLKSVRAMTDAVLDVHLMIEQPERYIETFADLGADILTVHAEALRHLDSTLELIRRHGMKAGVALNPATSLHVLDYVHNRCDMVLLMTVNPGFGGQSYIPEMTEKIRQMRQMWPEMDIEVDGGINRETIRTAMEAGANIFVEGSAVFNANGIEENVRAARQIFAKAQ